MNSLYETLLTLLQASLAMRDERQMTAMASDMAAMAEPRRTTDQPFIEGGAHA
jgi:hypothetical protein